ncbi:histidine kinase CKI1 [Senna tora]|uniref:histidine kinase n=1 Tax=Senna tora TaxID=362788 RepID=A0A834T9T9_9FABA|nr:histidine kinase CKI1 [Senna tora]
MELKEEEFDLSQFIEDTVDLFHPVAIRKGVDLVLDHCDGSVIRSYARVKGDRGKLKQILCNLLSNAVKFTDEGHIIVRAWAQKPNFQNSIIASNKFSFMKRLSYLCYKKNEADIDLEAGNLVQQDMNCLEFVFEVDDTGKGIPKEKQKSVFENYIQVEETALGLGGTGLGLGIVQSLVRLMHGDIRIVDKDIGEKGSCFRFNVILTVCETITGGKSTRKGNNEIGGDGIINQPQGLDIHTPSSGSSICSPSPRLPIFISSRLEASRVVLLIQNEARRRSTQRFMESLGIKVKVVKQWENLFHTLKKMKQKGSYSSQSSKGTIDMSSRSTSQNSNGRTKGVPLSATDGKDEYTTSVFEKTEEAANSLCFVLLVIDAIAGPFWELRRMVNEFRRGLGNPCKVVWLNKPLMRGVDLKAVDEDIFDPDDIVLSKPFHGTRLLQVIRLLPEYGGNLHSISGKESKARKSPVDIGEIQEYGDSSSSNKKPLGGSKFLVAEDTEILRRIAVKTLIQLGANSVEECKNGEDAVKVVEEALAGAFPNLPYDCILMDCEMPLMDGFEATRRIREMEKRYGVHIPIIALTAHTSGRETKMTIEAGMDVHLGKPLRKENLLEAIRYIHSEE